MKTEIATTLEQSARLLRCGVSADTADMFYKPCVMMTEQDSTRLILFARNELTAGDMPSYPAWSLSRLLSILPKEIDIDGYPYRISIYFENPDEPVIGNQWCLFYKPKKNTEKSRIDDVPMYAPDLIECAVLMVEWLTRHNIKLNEQ